MNLNAQEIKKQASGCWLAIISHLAPQLSHACQNPGRHVKCPCHGEQDGFRLFDNASETGGGIAIKLEPILMALQS